jgi:hypothetical protein
LKTSDDDAGVNAVSHRAIKRQEARQRVAAVRLARRSSRTARKVQRRVSLTGTGAKWRITNLRQVARAMAAWA